MFGRVMQELLRKTGNASSSSQLHQQNREQDGENDDVGDGSSPAAADETTSFRGEVNQAVNKMLSSARNAREGAFNAANQMWSRTKVVRSKFPSATSRQRKPSFNFGDLDKASLIEDGAVIYDSMKQMWEEDVFKLPVCKDLPRLVRRICVVDKDDEIMYLAPGAGAPDGTMLAQVGKPQESKGEEEPDREDSGAPPKRSSKLMRWSLRKKKTRQKSIKEEDLNTNEAIADLLVEFITVLADHLETEETKKVMVAKMKEIRASVTNGSDMQLVTKEIVEGLEKDSKVVKVLKCIHQNIVLQSTVELKQSLTMKYQTKDVRTSDGWRILITLSKGFVQVRHTRREQSMDAFGDTKNHWEFEWELRMTFSESMDTMTAAQLRVTRLILSETMDEDLAKELKNTLVDGLIVM